MTTFAMVLGFAFWLLIIFTVGAAIGRHRRMIRAERTPPLFDMDAARREAHVAGFPFYELDGSVSWPKRTDREVHAELHGRRLAAQPEVAAMKRVERCLPHMVADLRAKGLDDAAIVARLDWRFSGPNPRCDECDGAGVLVMGYTANYETGTVRRYVVPCHACRK